MFKYQVEDDFEVLAESLTLRDSFEPAAPLIFAHVRFVQELLNQFILSETLLTTPVKEALAQLPEENILHLLSSPYLCELLMIAKERGPLNSEPLRLQILQALIAEIRLANPNFMHALKTKWTVDGDAVLDPKIAQKFPALRTSCGIHLNYQSYVHNTAKKGIGGYDYAAALKHKERIETGKSIAAAVSPSALSLIDTFTNTIQVRINRNRPSVVNSSTHTSIGLVRCDNFHHLHEDMPEIVDMLVHESIHQYLHLFEEQLFPFINIELIPKELLDQRNFPSPWSGSPLDLRSYTHAILVWYGLWHFWGQFLDSGFAHPEVSTAQAHQKRQEAAFGFVNSRSVLDNLGEAKKYLVAEYRAQIESLQNEFLL